jgi:TetR/AcrR family transcriptional regulator
MSSATKPELKRPRARGAGRPPGATAEQTREEILDAALRAFADAGFEAMSVRELTRALGVSHNLVHHHFGSKHDLWCAAIDHGMGATVRELAELMGQGVGSSNPLDILRAGMELGMALLLERPAIARILADEAARPGPRLDHLYERYLDPVVAVLRRFLTESRAHGVRDVDSRVAALFALSTVSALVTYGALAEKLGLDEASRDRNIASLIDLTLGGLTADP